LLAAGAMGGAMVVNAHRDCKAFDRTPTGNAPHANVATHSMTPMNPAPPVTSNRMVQTPNCG
jgi:hypothetical protein